MKIKNIELEQYIQFLDQLDLSGTQSRMRTRFKNLLIEYNTRFHQERLDIIKTYSNLDENGNIKIIKNKDREIPDWKENGEENANKEFQELCFEDVVIEENEERKQILLSVKDAILNCNKTFSGEDADFYDEVCLKFENIYRESV